MRKIIYKVISPKKRFDYKVKVLKFIANNSFLTSIYYLINKEFSREQKSVLSGKVNHLIEKKNNSSNEYLLRRNIHRIEKGLIMNPMREIFALDYIEETVHSFVNLSENFELQSKISDQEVKWFHDVLNNYFSVVKDTKMIKSLKKTFEMHKFDIKSESVQYVPFKQNSIIKSEISIEELEKLAYQRRSVRWFKKQSIPEKKLINAIKIASLSPSACNRQPFKYIYLNNEEELKEFTQIPMGTKGYNENIPAMIAVVGDLSAYPFERDRHLIYIDSALATMSFIYALEVQGLSSCIINWPDMEEKEVEISRFLKLNQHERVTMLIAIGYPENDGKIPYSQKKSVENILIHH